MLRSERNLRLAKNKAGSAFTDSEVYGMAALYGFSAQRQENSGRTSAATLRAQGR